MSAKVFWQHGRDFAGLSGPVISREQWQTIGEARALLDAAAEHRASSEAVCEQQRREAVQRGYLEGLELGRLAGVRELIAQSESAERFIDGMSESLVSLAETALRQFLDEHDFTPQFRRQLARAVDTARHEQQPRLRVSPEQRELAEEMLNSLPGPLEHLSLVADPALQGADVVLECEHVIVDGRINTRPSPCSSASTWRT